MRWFTSTLIAANLLAGCAHASFPHGAAPALPPACSLYTDPDLFCANAPANANPPDFPATWFTSYANGGHTTYNASAAPSGHPPPYNLANIDFSVGITSLKASLTPASSIAVAGCAYSANSARTPLGSGPGVTCKPTGTNCTLDIEGYDFTGVWLELAANPSCSGSTNTFTTKNLYHASCPQCTPTGGIGQFTKVDVTTTQCVDYTSESETFVGSGVGANTDDFTLDQGCGSVSETYDKLLLTAGRVNSGPWGTSGATGLPTGHADFLFAANYVEGMCYPGGVLSEHCEINEFGSLSSFTTNSVRYAYNTLYETTAALGLTGWTWGNGNQATFHATFVGWRTDHNVMVILFSAPSAAYEGYEVRYDGDTYTSPTSDHNYFLPVGAFGCFANSGSGNVTGDTYTNNVDMFDGSPWNQIDSGPTACKGSGNNP